MSSTSKQAPTSFDTEFDILKASHKFLRENEDPAEARNAPWNDQLAQKYYSSLFREFAVCDLKHYKSGNLALRWRTEAEVLSGAGETSCGNTRCEHHDNPDAPAQLATLELPFTYEEHGERKSALVKVVLCPRCTKKLMWKHNKQKETRAAAAAALEGPSGQSSEKDPDDRELPRRSKDREDKGGSATRLRDSRSRSPRDKRAARSSRRRRSRSP
ncbi:folate-sensitive fragile site protein Fra10Ac1-domain-containing protein [Gloeopeniophorella convolvens]|nr:folate-sensitive fragile site protein Fra10Ac1-domain-containing protein [Gloeopeniophorella convolvens]